MNKHINNYKKNINISKGLLSFFKKSIILHLVVTMFVFVFAVLQANYFSQIVDCAISMDMSMLLSSSIVICLISVVYYFVRTFFTIVCDNADDKARQFFGERVVGNLFKQNISVLCKFSPGMLRKYIDFDAKKIANFYINTLPIVFSNTIFMIALLFLILQKSIMIGGIIFLLALIQIIPNILSSLFEYKYYDADKEAQAKWSENIMVMYQMNPLVKVFQLHDYFFRKFKELNRIWDCLGRKASAVGRISEGIVFLINNVLTVCVYLIMGFYILSQGMHLNEATYLIILATYLFQNTNAIFGVLPQIAEYRKAKEIMFEWCEDKKEKYDISISSVSLHNIGISYDGQNYLKDFSCKINLANKYVLFGKNGSGKTSILECILKIKEITYGKIEYGSSEISSQEISRKIYYLPQEDAMLDLTGQELFIQYDDRHEQIFSLANKLGLTHENIYETTIRDLSGGERKKVYLCLALTMKFKFLLLDEPTNFLDSSSKSVLVQELLNRDYGFLVVSHDPFLLKSMQENCEYIEI